jgi:hypothetical protein
VENANINVNNHSKESLNNWNTPVIIFANFSTVAKNSIVAGAIAAGHTTNPVRTENPRNLSTVG